MSEQELNARIVRIASFMKRHLGYRGSKDTADMAQDVWVRLLRTYGREGIQERREEMLRMVRTATRNAIEDARRRQIRRPHHGGARISFDEGLIGTDNTPEQSAIIASRVALLELELILFEQGVTGIGIAPETRRHMLEALQMKRSGMTDQQIGDSLGLSREKGRRLRSTLELLLIRRIAEAELEAR